MATERIIIQVRELRVDDRLEMRTNQTVNVRKIEPCPGQNRRTHVHINGQYCYWLSAEVIVHQTQRDLATILTLAQIAAAGTDPEMCKGEN